MIERIGTSARMSKIVKHGGIAYLCGQVGDGATVAEQTRDCLARIDALLAEAGHRRSACFRRSSGWPIWRTLPK